MLPARLVLLASLYSAPATAQAPRTLAELAPNASGIALAEVVEVKSFDERPGDGNAGVRFNLRLVRGSGQFRDSISVVTDFGGLRPPGVEPPDPKTHGPLKADSLKKGERYWFAFASNPMLLTHECSQGIVAFWTEKQPKPVEQLEGAVKEDLFKWSPQFDPQTALSYGHLITKDHSRVRVEKAGKVLWEKKIPGKMIDQEYAFGLSGAHGSPETIPAAMPRSGRILCVKFTTELAKENEYGVRQGKFTIEFGLDPETGKRHAAWLTMHLLDSGGIMDALHLEYDADRDKPKREHRFEDLKAGGNAVGAKSENWWRKTSRDFNPATGKLMKEELFWYDKDAPFELRWVRVMK